MLNGLVPDKDIEIKFTGLKPGEKMYEELFRDGDIRKDTGHSDIFAAVAGEADSALSEEQLHGQAFGYGSRYGEDAYEDQRIDSGLYGVAQKEEGGGERG